MRRHNTPEYKAYEELRFWKPGRKILPPQALFDKKSKLFELFNYLYEQTKETYSLLPLRKNGDNSFIHPLNVVLGLKQAGIDDETTLCAGLIHDVVEEKVDLYKREKQLGSSRKDVAKLDVYEKELYDDFAQKLNGFCHKRDVCAQTVEEIVEIAKLLTRHKRDFYYRSISQIFQHSKDDIKEKAIQIKLADRMHNILSIETFDNGQRIYACFKNLFILNNTKKYLLDKYGKHMFTGKKLNPTEILFKRCAKATYEAFLTICHRCLALGIGEIKSMVQLAFKKYAMEKRAVWKLTRPRRKEIHLMRLFHGIVRKYDYRLHHEWDMYKICKADEENYCRRFFADYKFSSEQINAILHYKDAYSLKEVIANLLYLPDYFVAQFLSSELTKRGRIKQ